jgi:hypothetical protein
MFSIQGYSCGPRTRSARGLHQEIKLHVLPLARVFVERLRFSDSYNRILMTRSSLNELAEFIRFRRPANGGPKIHCLGFFATLFLLSTATVFRKRTLERAAADQCS